MKLNDRYKYSYGTSEEKKMREWISTLMKRIFSFSRQFNEIGAKIFVSIEAKPYLDLFSSFKKIDGHYKFSSSEVYLDQNLKINQMVFYKKTAFYFTVTKKDSITKLTLNNFTDGQVKKYYGMKNQFHNEPLYDHLHNELFNKLKKFDNWQPDTELYKFYLIENQLLKQIKEETNAINQALLQD